MSLLAIAVGSADGRGGVGEGGGAVTGTEGFPAALDLQQNILPIVQLIMYNFHRPYTMFGRSNPRCCSIVGGAGVKGGGLAGGG